ncbi:hypothetical protein [Paenibacillus endoradicis]|uniref:hypothetical protein n=1 Tax=Paenibacillus endoradicis TaxID=2972487 RepID=UPI0021596400|nr:hypothetical protein [Paenibacillus endoradicis]MCR8657857.1 hypothetical protein [Paenibacillus endoradicis]
MRINQLWFRKDGSVTIFCTLMMTVLILFFMVLLDYARILLFHRTTESAAMLSIQSVLSAYDQQIYEQYGLFGRGGTDNNDLFKGLVQANHGTSMSLFSLKQTFDLAPLEVGEMSVTTDHYLGEYDVFRRQVLEEMKYKAPIEFSLEFMDKWVTLSDSVSQAESMMDTMNRLEDLFLEREKKLEKAMELHEMLGKQLPKSSYYMYATSKLSKVVSGYSSYHSWMNYQSDIMVQLQSDSLTEEQKEELESESTKYDEQISSYLNSYNQMSKYLKMYANDLQKTSDQIATEILSNIATASTLNNTIEVQYELYMNSGQQGTTPIDSNDLGQQLSSLTFDDEGLVRPEQFFQEYKKEIQSQQQLLDEYIDHNNSLLSELSSAINSPNVASDASVKQTSLNQLMKKSTSLKQQYETAYYSPATILSFWQKQVNSTKLVKDQLKQNEKQYSEQLSELASITELFANKEKVSEYKDQYKKLEERYEFNYRINKEQEEDQEPDSKGDEATGRKQAQAATYQLKSLLQSLGEMALNARDYIYLNEYIMNRYTHFPLGESSSETSSIDAEFLDYSKQEVEYIIYGVHEPLENVLLAYGEIFAFRFAIRTIEGLIANRVLGNPILVFSAAVVHGIRAAMVDMQQLLTKGSTELSKYVPIQIEYAQYLRLFLIMHAGGRDKRLSRMIAVIEQKLSITLLSVPTAITGQVTTTMSLWSLPGISEMIGAVTPMNNRIRGNIYEKTDIVTVSY